MKITPVFDNFIFDLGASLDLGLERNNVNSMRFLAHMKACIKTISVGNKTKQKYINHVSFLCDKNK